jgi:polyphosphate glucokinase
MVIDGSVEPMELGHMQFKKGRTFEDYVGLRGLKRLGKARWRKAVADVVERLRGALLPEYIVLGGGNAKKLKALPPGAELGNNANAFRGGFRMWEHYGGHAEQPPPQPKRARARRER